MPRNTIFGISGFFNEESELKSRGGLNPMRGYINAKLRQDMLREIIAYKESWAKRGKGINKHTPKPIIVVRQPQKTGRLNGGRGI